MNRSGGIKTRHWRSAVTAILLVAAAARVSAEPIANPNFGKLPQLRLRVQSERSGKLIQTSRVWVELPDNSEAPVSVHAETLLTSGVKIESRTLLRAGATVRCLQVEWRVLSRDGETVSSTLRQFRPDALPYAGFNMPEDTYPLNETLLYLLGSLPMESNDTSSLHVLGELQAFKVDVRRHGSEEITVPAGRFSCDHLRLRPNVESLRLPAVLRPLARLFLPEFDIWVSRTVPHVAVRFRGPFGPPDDRDVVLELLELGVAEE